MKSRRKRPSPRSEINVTPFIDILLVLLVIFMTITPSTPAGLNTNVPQVPPPGTQKEQGRPIVLVMDRGGNIKINQDEVELSDLIERLQEIFKTRYERTVFVQADEELLFNDVARLIDAAKGAGVDRVGLMTEPIP